MFLNHGKASVLRAVADLGRLSFIFQCLMCFPLYPAVTNAPQTKPSKGEPQTAEPVEFLNPENFSPKALRPRNPTSPLAMDARPQPFCNRLATST